MKDKILSFLSKRDKNYYDSASEEKKEVSPKKEQKDYEKLRVLAIEKFKTRRSIRKFSEQKEIPWKIIYDIIDASTNAPCAGNIQNYRIIVVTDQKKKQEIARAQSQQYWIADAPYLIAVTRDNKKLLELFPEQGEKFALQNTSAVIENILMLAHFHDLGACWVEACNNDVMRELLGAPQSVFIDGVIPIGIPNENPKVQKIPTAELLKYESYGNSKRELKY